MNDMQVIGVGTRDRGDDAVGLSVAEALRAEWLPGVDVSTAERDGALLFQREGRASCVAVVDAVSSGAAPGTIHRICAHAQQTPVAMLRCSTHAFGLAESIELSRALHQLPETVVIYGIEGASFEMGNGLSDAVAAAVPEVVERIKEEIVGWVRREEPIATD